MAPALTPPPCSDPSPEPKSVPDVPAAPVVPVSSGQSKDIVLDPTPAPITLPEEPIPSNSVDAPESPDATPLKPEKEEPTAAPAEQPCAHFENTEPEKEAEPCSQTPLTDSASSIAPAEKDTPPAAANGDMESHELTPILAPTATPISEPEIIPVTNGLPQEPEELQGEELVAEPMPLTQPEEAEVPEIHAKTSAPVKEEQEEEERVEEEPAPAEETTMQGESVSLG